jgi:hypothetical protein
MMGLLVIGGPLLRARLLGVRLEQSRQKLNRHRSCPVAAWSEWWNRLSQAKRRGRAPGEEGSRNALGGARIGRSRFSSGSAKFPAKEVAEITWTLEPNAGSDKRFRLGIRGLLTLG